MSVNAHLAKLSKLEGTDAFNKRVQELNANIEAAIPNNARLPASILDDLPLNVMEVPETCGLLSKKEIEITNLDATGVRDSIAKGELSAVDALTAFGKRAAIAHQLVHCLTDLFIEEGLQRAKELDEHFKKTGKVVGPLHGVPISIKDHMPVKGHLASSGYLATLTMQEEDGDQVAIFRKLGAVFYCKTNQPQGIMHLESHSFWGRTLNPWNLKLTPGGSSGGASALVAMKGSCISPGTDIGGSIRNPCAQTGIYGMRPTSQTMPTGGHLWYQGGYDGIVCSTGPMVASARDIDLFIRSVMSTNPALTDPYVIPQVWSPPDLKGKKIKVGIMLHNGQVLPHPPILRALDQAKKKLSAHPDIEVVDFEPFKHDEGYALARELYFPEGPVTVKKFLKEAGEPMHTLTEYGMAPPTGEHTTLELFDLYGKREAYRRAHLADWVKQGCDVLLCPTFPGTANPHDTARYWAYTSQWNLTDFPGIVFPSGLYVDPSLDKAPTDFKPMSDKDAENNKIYDAELMAGSPISFQLISRKFNDQVLVSAQKIIEDIIKS